MIYVRTLQNCVIHVTHITLATQEYKGGRSKAKQTKCRRRPKGARQLVLFELTLRAGARSRILSFTTDAPRRCSCLRKPSPGLVQRVLVPRSQFLLQHALSSDENEVDRRCQCTQWLDYFPRFILQIRCCTEAMQS